MADLLTYGCVPKAIQENLLWRYFLRRKLTERPEFREVIERSCKQDVLFYINSFIWVFEPRSMKIDPFVTWDYQDDAIMKIFTNIEGAIADPQKRFDVGWDKSRDMGATWCVLSVADFYWRFRRGAQILCISRVEHDVDQAKNEKTLFRKLDFIEEMLPPAFQVRGIHHDQHHGRTHLTIHNPYTRSNITGEASSPHAGRSGRYLFVFRDEEAAAENGFKITSSLNSTTRCQVRVSTPQGIGGSFHTAKTKGGIDWITTHWTRHPEKRKGLYSIEGGVVKVIDGDWHAEHPGYEFWMTPTHADPGAEWEFMRSPWFDEEDRSADSVADLAQEHQISYMGSGSPYFRPDRLAIARARSVRPPLEVGLLSDFIPDLPGVADMDVRRDKCKLWCQRLPVKRQFQMYEKPAVEMRPPQDTTYTLGIDVAAGSGASDSVISVGDDTSCSKVFEYRTNGVTPEEFAKIVAAVYNWFETNLGPAYVAWDAGGHGNAFGTALMRVADPLAYYHHATRGGAPAKAPGVPENDIIKKQTFNDYRGALFEGTFLTPSREAFSQAEQFKLSSNGTPVHQQSEAQVAQPSAIGKQHGDIVTSEVILWLAMQDRPAPEPPERVIAYASPAWFARKREQEKEEIGMFEEGGEY